MKLHYAGKYSGNPDDLPYLEHEPGAVKFKEADDAAKFGRIIAVLSIVIVIVLIIISWIRAKDVFFSYSSLFLYILTIIPHELLHAICYKDDVYLYHDLKNGMLFVTGPERTSKGRWIFRSMLPSIVLGFIPYIIFLINPKFQTLGTLGALGIGTAAGDFYNVYKSLTQMPKGSWAYYHKYDRYWYMPEKLEAQQL